MKRNFKIGVSLALTGMMILGSLTPVFATVNETQTTSENETLATDVLYNQDSSFTVTIPKLITLDSTKISNYTVTVTGDIASNEQVNVIPEKEFLMKDQALTGTKKTDVTATVSQDKEGWKFNEFTTLGNGTVTAEGLTSGSWKGSFWFNISLDNLENEATTLEAGLYDADGVMLCTWEESGINLDAQHPCPPPYSPYKEESPHYILNNVYPSATMVVLPNNLTELKNYAMSYCDNIVTIIIPESVQTIGTNAFEDCTSLTSITIPNGVSVINNNTFNGCINLNEIILPNTITKIGTGVFTDTSWLKSKQQENPLVIVNDIVIDGTTANGDVIIPDIVTKISSNAFISNDNLTSITFPISVTNIGEDAFRYCNNLTEIIFNNNAITIEDRAFADCEGLTQIILPDNIQTIDYLAFYDCTNLTSIIYKEITYTSKSGLIAILTTNNVTIGASVFDNTGLSN